MDTSPEHIKMCRMAHELQEMWKPSQGDWLFLRRIGDSPGYIKTIGGFNLNSGYYFFRDSEEIVIRDDRDCVTWLPRIDQLLPPIYTHLKEHGRVHYSNPIDNLKYIIDEYGTGDGFNRNELSEEEYFMMVLMYEKYDKIWNGEDWI